MTVTCNECQKPFDIEASTDPMYYLGSRWVCLQCANKQNFTITVCACGKLYNAPKIEGRPRVFIEGCPTCRKSKPCDDESLREPIAEALRESEDSQDIRPKDMLPNISDDSNKERTVLQWGDHFLSYEVHTVGANSGHRQKKCLEIMDAVRATYLWDGYADSGIHAERNLPDWRGITPSNTEESFWKDGNREGSTTLTWNDGHASYEVKIKGMEDTERQWVARRLTTHVQGYLKEATGQTYRLNKGDILISITGPEIQEVQRIAGLIDDLDLGIEESEPEQQFCAFVTLGGLKLYAAVDCHQLIYLRHDKSDDAVTTWPINEANEWAHTHDGAAWGRWTVEPR